MFTAVSASSQLELLRSHRQTPEQYAAYATAQIGKRISMNSLQQQNVHHLYLAYAEWLVKVNPDDKRLKAYKKQRDDTLRTILTNPQYTLKR